MRRRLEPEPMERPDLALAYAEADFSESNRLFVELLGQLGPGPLRGARALDLGCGPGDIALRFLRAYPDASCDALDGSPSMIEQARATLDRFPGAAARCRLLCHRLPSTGLARAHYDLILSSGLLHRLHDPQVLWSAVREAAKPGALVLVMDLMRPASAGWAEALVETYGKDLPQVLRKDFRDSLFAAFEPQEVADQLREAGLEELEVRVVSDRHLAVSGRLPAGI